MIFVFQNSPGSFRECVSHCKALWTASELNQQPLFSSTRMFSSDSWTEPQRCCFVNLSHLRLAVNVIFKWEFHGGLGWLPFSRQNSQDLRGRPSGNRGSGVLISDRNKWQKTFFFFLSFFLEKSANILQLKSENALPDNTDNWFSQLCSSCNGEEHLISQSHELWGTLPFDKELPRQGGQDEVWQCHRGWPCAQGLLMQQSFRAFLFHSYKSRAAPWTPLDLVIPWLSGQRAGGWIHCWFLGAQLSLCTVLH